MLEFIQEFGVAAKPCTLSSTTVSVLKNLGLLRIRGAYVLCMPYEKEKDGSVRDLAYPVNDSTLQMIQKAVIAEYEKTIGPITRTRRRTWLPT
jgi:DNA-binding cell septation regulator SpoVG